MERSYSRKVIITTLVILLILLLCAAPEASAAVETEPNDKLGIANSIGAGEIVTGTFSPRGDQDWCAVTLDSPGRLECAVTSPPANIRAYITMYNRNADYVYVTSGAINEGDDVFLTYDVLEPGTYYIRLTDRDNDTSDESYTFTADFTPVVDNREPNNQLGAGLSYRKHRPYRHHLRTRRRRLV